MAERAAPPGMAPAGTGVVVGARLGVTHLTETRTSFLAVQSPVLGSEFRVTLIRPPLYVMEVHGDALSWLDEDLFSNQVDVLGAHRVVTGRAGEEQQPTIIQDPLRRMSVFAVALIAPR